MRRRPGARETLRELAGVSRRRLRAATASAVFPSGAVTVTVKLVTGQALITGCAV
jgi:hypothetical protein